MSSAKRWMEKVGEGRGRAGRLEARKVGKSLMKSIKRRGPKTFHFGTSLATSIAEERKPSTFTHCERPMPTPTSPWCLGLSHV